MESKNNEKEEIRFKSTPFKILYITIFVLLITIDIRVIFQLLTVWANLEIVVFLKLLPFIWMYVLFLFSPIVKLGFEAIEIVRFVQFLRSDNNNKEGAMNVARGFRGTRIFRVYYLILMLGFLIWMDYFIFTTLNPSVEAPGEAEFVRFYFWFEILLYFHVLPIIVGPRLIKISIDSTNKKRRTIVIVTTIIWIVVLILVLNIDLLIYLVVS